MRIKVRKKPQEKLKISVFSSKNKFKKVKDINDFISMYKEVEDIVSSIKEDVDFKLIMNLDI